MFERWKRFWKRDSDLELELQGHLETEIEERIQAGESADAARSAALRSFGNRITAAEDTRAVWGWPSLEAVVQDLRHGARLLWRSRAFTVFAVVSLALGIGATTAIFTLFNAIVLKPLPVRAPESLVELSFGTNSERANSILPYPQFERMRDANRTLEGLVAINGPSRTSVAVAGESQLANRLYATASYYPLLGLKPALGRLLFPDDDRPGNPVAVISYSYWQSRFGGNSNVIGSGIQINQVPFTVVGVEPKGFFGISVGTDNDVTLPMRAMELFPMRRPLFQEANSTWIRVMGRLKPGITLSQAAQDLTPSFVQVAVDAASSTPEKYRADALQSARETKVFLKDGSGGLRSALRDQYAKWLRLLLGLLAAVMLLAALNVATLLLSRSEARRREIATRMALGAQRWRLIRQLLTESALLAGIGAAFGLMLAWWGSDRLIRIALPTIDRVPLDLTPDARVLGFTIACSALICLLFGLLPAIRATASNRTASSFDREVGRRRRKLLDRTLVASQVGLSVVLVVFAGLFLRTLTNLWSQDTGYGRDNILMFSVRPSLPPAQQLSQSRNFYLQLLEELKRVPLVQVATASVVRPVDDEAYYIDVVTNIGVHEFTPKEAIRIAHNLLAPGYFSALRVPLLAGRDFSAQDDVNAPKVAIISETMAKRRFNGQYPIGQTITMSNSDKREIIGVARDVRYGNVKEAPRDVVYRPMFQTSAEDFGFIPSFEIRYVGGEEEARRQVQAAVSRLDPQATLFRMKTLALQTEESLARERLLAMLTTYFGIFALLLACIGLYGLMSYVVTQRTPEIGLRMALGAMPGELQWLVLRESAGTVMAGIAVGVAGSIAAVRLVQTLLFGVEPADPATFVAAILLLLVLAGTAAYVPALRASRIDPVTALRDE